MPIPLVAIVGRPNVGKSTLFNTLLRRRVAIVSPTAGTTRDRVVATLNHGGRTIGLVDTGGLGIVDEARLTEHIAAQIDIALRDATVIVFVVDVRDGLTGLDRQMAARLRKLDQPVILVANKADVRNLEFEAHSFHSLGLGEPVAVSALGRVNTREVLDRAVAVLPDEDEPPADGSLKIAILGKRNAGKSTMLNALAGTPRVIVSELPGTTRDAVDVKIVHGGREYTFIDTAGVVKRTLVDDAIEYYAQVRTAEAVHRCDVAMLVLDINRDIEQTDKKTASMIADEHKPVVLVCNKWDLAKASTTEFVEYFHKTLPQLSFAPISFVSALKGERLWETVRVAEELAAQGAVRVETAEVNRMFARALEERSPRVSRSKVPKVFYVTQVRVSPPTFAVFVNDPRLFPQDYRRFLENRIRQEFPYAEIPVRLLFRSRNPVDRKGGNAGKRRTRR